jgi:uncharacterized protein YceK
MRKLLITLAACIMLTGCSPIEQQARNTAAALQGTIIAAQAQYQTSCKANPAQTVCGIIDKGVAGENALITAIETYCSWSPTAPPTNPNATCTPVASAEAGLNAAIANAATLTLQIKGAI